MCSKGEPLTDEERARLTEIRARGPVPAIPHAEVMRQLHERIRRGE